MAGRGQGQKKKGGIGNVISTLVLLIAIGIFCFAAWKLVTIYLDYKTGVDEYTALEEYADNEKVTEGLDIVDKIACVETDYYDKPLQEQKIKSITVETFGEEYPEPVKVQ